MFRRLINTTAVLALGISSVVTHVHAGEEMTYNSGNDSLNRVALARELLVLTKAIPSSACQIELEAGLEHANEHLDEAEAEFDGVINALTAGDEEFGIPAAEENQMVLRSMEGVVAEWETLKPLIEAARNDSISVEQVAELSHGSDALLDRVKAFQVEMSEHHSVPGEITDAESFLLDLASRQALLLQTVSKAACMVEEKNEAEAHTPELIEAAASFSATLDALLTGMPAMGIEAPPTDEIKAGLTEVSEAWASMKPTVDAIAAGEILDTDTLGEFFDVLDKTTMTMCRVVELYTIHMLEG